MAVYKINEGYSGARTVKADFFRTEGEFVDFYENLGAGEVITVLRVRADWVQRIELAKNAE